MMSAISASTWQCMASRQSLLSLLGVGAATERTYPVESRRRAALSIDRAGGLLGRARPITGELLENRLQQGRQLLGMRIVVACSLDGHPMPRAADRHDHRCKREGKPGTCRHLRNCHVAREHMALADA